MPHLPSCIVRVERQQEGLARGSRGQGVMDTGCWWALGPADLPGGQATHVLPLLPDSEDRENLLRNGVTHILSVHNRAKPVLEVSARAGGLGGPPRGGREGADGGHRLFARHGAERGAAMLDLHHAVLNCTQRGSALAFGVCVCGGVGCFGGAQPPPRWFLG